MASQVWSIITRVHFDNWFEIQPNAVQEEILAILCILREDGPHLGRPLVDTLTGSCYCNIKELRIQIAGHPVRIFFAFDPIRRAVILCAGNKKGQNEKRFYKKLIKEAETEYKAHLEETCQR